MILACLSTVNILYRKELILIKFQHMEFIKISDGILDLIEPEGTDSGRPQVQIMVQFKKKLGHSLWGAEGLYWSLEVHKFFGNKMHCNSFAAVFFFYFGHKI
jgi:hypothetical protein